MIAKIETVIQYGRDGQAGISILPDLEEPEGESYAHSVQDALEWLKRLPLYHSAVIDDLADGRLVVTSKWLPRNEVDRLLDSDDGIDRAGYTRNQAVVYPVTTIH